MVLVDQALCDADRLGGNALVVAHHQLKLAATDPAALVDDLCRDFGPLQKLLAKEPDLAGERQADADLHRLIRSRGAARQRHCQREPHRYDNRRLAHCNLPIMAVCSAVFSSIKQ
jgi:hypothetical protein